MTRIISATSRVLASLMVAAALAVTGLLVVTPRLTSGTWLTVLTGSMGPTIPAGSLVLVKPVDPATIEPGDVITWQVRPGEATYVTHRVVRVRDAAALSFVTKGDANEGEDTDPVPAGAVRGKVTFHVPHLGGVRSQIEGAFGIGILFAAAGVAFLVPQLRRIAGSRRPDDETADALSAIEVDGGAGTEPGAGDAIPAPIEPELLPVGGRSGDGGRRIGNGFLYVAVIGLAAVAAGRGLTTAAPFSDYSTLTAAAGAANWAVAEAPPECADMTFDNVIEGTSGDDVLYGTNGADLILGFYGNDKLYGGNQEDCLVGGPGQDELDGGNGKDVLVGGAGSDRLESENAKDKLYGGPDDDTLLGGNAPDVLDGGDGNDTCSGGHAPDVVNCEGTDDTP